MVEILIITVLVLWSCIIVFKKLMPKTSNNVFKSLSIWCEAKGWKGLARRLAPKVASGCGGSCGCSTDDKPEISQEIKAVKWK